MRPRRLVRHIVACVSVSCAALLLVSGLAAADTHSWTNQADFQAGTLTNLDATGSPGSLTLARNATSFSPYAGNPVFAPNSSGWDSVAVIPYSVMRLGGTWVMWYTGTNGTGEGIGRATSADGIHWIRNPTTPLLTAADLPIVLYESGIYEMWYQYVSGAYMPSGVDYATSADGILWTPYSGNPVLQPSSSGFDSLIVSPGGVIHDVSGYRLWYSGGDGSSNTYSVGLASSSDGINWTRYSGNPVISPPFGGWYDSTRVIACGVLPWNGGLLMGYVGADANYVQRVALATSGDGVHWSPVPGPTLNLGPSGSWDNLGLSRMAIANVGGNLTMWYGGSPSSGSWETGLATAPSYASVGTFASAVLDSGNANTSWISIGWTGTTPTNTAIGISLEVGNTSSPDARWSVSRPYVTTPAVLGLPKGRYARVLLAMASTDPTQTPTLQSITVTYQPPTSPGPGGIDLVALTILIVLGAIVAAFIGVVAFLMRRPRPALSPAAPQVAQACARCGSPIPAGNSFCGRCGAPQSPPEEVGPPKQ